MVERVRAAFISTLLLGAAVLSGGLLPAQASSVRDSAGIRIVSNGPRLSAPIAFKLGDKPLIRVGGLEADPAVELDFKGNNTGVRLSSGGFVVADKVRLQFFDANSKRLKIVGRYGGGPQEFQYIGAICRTRGDTLVVSDEPNGRVAIVDGRKMLIVRTIPRMHYGSLVEHGCFDDGTFLLNKQTGPEAIVEHFTRRRIDGTVVTDLGDIDRPHGEALVPSQLQMSAFGDRFVLSNTFTNDLRIYDATGKLASIVRSSDQLTRATAAELRVIAERLVSALSPKMSASQRAQRASEFVNWSRITTWPAHYRVLADPSGQLWVQDYQRAKWTTAPWTAFDVNGKIIGRLVVPTAPGDHPEARVVAFGVNDIQIKSFDSDGAPYLSVYPLVRLPTKN